MSTAGGNSWPARPLPHGYPDEAKVGPFRFKDIEFSALHIRMTITPGEEIIVLWELEEDHPVEWIGNVFRIDTEPPGLRLSSKYARHLARSQHEALARRAVGYWMS